MTRKKATARKNTPAENHHRVSFEIVPSIATALVSFANGRLDFLSEKYGSISVETSESRYTFKIIDMLNIVETQDDFIIFQLRSMKEDKPVDELIGFSKTDLKMVYADFHNEVRYKTDKKQNVSADKMVS